MRITVFLAVLATALIVAPCSAAPAAGKGSSRPEPVIVIERVKKVTVSAPPSIVHNSANVRNFPYIQDCERRFITETAMVPSGIREYALEGYTIADTDALQKMLGPDFGICPSIAGQSGVGIVIVRPFMRWGNWATIRVVGSIKKLMRMARPDLYYRNSHNVGCNVTPTAGKSVVNGSARPVSPLTVPAQMPDTTGPNHPLNR